jgi:L-amino acid N-acyltransferase YncA
MTLLNAIITAGDFSAMDRPVSLAEQRAFIANYPATGVFFVALSGDELLGMQDVMPCATSPELTGEVSTFVRLGRQGQGIGSSLSAVTLLAARQRGFKRLYAKIRADNPKALRFYQHQGFRCVAHETARIRSVVTDIVVTERRLAP